MTGRLLNTKTSEEARRLFNKTVEINKLLEDETPNDKLNILMNYVSDVIQEYGITEEQFYHNLKVRKEHIKNSEVN